MQRPGLGRGVLFVAYAVANAQLIAAAMTLAIRPATSADIPAITRIYAHAVEHGTASFELEPPDEAEMTRRMESCWRGKFPYLAAELDGALAGYAYAAPYRTRPAYRFTVENSVYVAPDMHRRGIGKALLEALDRGLHRSAAFG